MMTSWQVVWWSPGPHLSQLQQWHQHPRRGGVLQHPQQVQYSDSQKPMRCNTCYLSLQLVFDGGRLSDSEEARLGSTVVDLSQVRLRETCLHRINSEAKHSFSGGQLQNHPGRQCARESRDCHEEKWDLSEMTGCQNSIARYINFFLFLINIFSRYTHSLLIININGFTKWRSSGSKGKSLVVEKLRTYRKNWKKL